MTLIFGETVRDIVPIAAIDGKSLHPHAPLFLQSRDKAGQFAACVPGMRPPRSVNRAVPGAGQVKLEPRSRQPGQIRARLLVAVPGSLTAAGAPWPSSRASAGPSPVPASCPARAFTMPPLLHQRRRFQIPSANSGFIAEM